MWRMWRWGCLAKNTEGTYKSFPHNKKVHFCSMSPGDRKRTEVIRRQILTHWRNFLVFWTFQWKNTLANTLATWGKELTHWKRPWCWQRLKAGGEGDDRGWDGWMALPTQWTWVWASSRSWWWTGRPSVLQSMGLQRVGHNWGTELNWINQETEI